MRTLKRRQISDADQIKIWKAVIALMDGRTAWARALKKAVSMIEKRDAMLAERKK